MFVRRFRSRREVRNYDLLQFSLNALKEGFKAGQYRLPRQVRRFLRRPLEAYAHRPRMIQAVVSLATLIGRFHTGENNFVQRGCGIGAEGAGFFLSRKGLCGPRGFANLTEALVREATAFLIEIGFIERITPPGELTEVRAPKNAKNPLGYFRRGLKAKKDALGRIRSPLTMYRLGRDTRQLFAKTLRPQETWNASAVEEPLWINSSKILADRRGTNVEGVHSGSGYDRAGHDPGDPRFSYWRPDPDRDPFSTRPAQRQAAEANLRDIARQPKPALRLSAEALKRWR